MSGKSQDRLDVAYKYDILKYIFTEAKTVLFIDHHITIHNDVVKLQKELSSNIKIIYDEYECGASLLWKHLYTEPLPLFIEYVKDNDIGLWKMDYTYELIAGLETTASYQIDSASFTARINSFATSSIPAGTVSSSAQITALGFATTASVDIICITSNTVFDAYSEMSVSK